MPKRFICWGTHFEDERPFPVSEYEFDTPAELDAFMRGVDAAVGWLSYTDGATEGEARENGKLGNFEDDE